MGQGGYANVRSNPAQYAEWKEGGFIHTAIVITHEKPKY
jgi:hypothetical protein